jgi:HSP20 family protein
MRKNELTPLRGLDTWPLSRPWDELFQRYFTPTTWGRGENAWSPQVDAKETSDAFEFTAEMPGLKPEDVHVTVTPDAITIAGEKRSEERKEEDNWVRTERSYGAFQRVFAFPSPVDPDAVKAETHDGLLTIQVKKSQVSSPRRVQVKKR